MEVLFNLISGKEISKPLKLVPWKNGKGFTTEIKIHPSDATISDFEFRVS